MAGGLLVVFINLFVCVVGKSFRIVIVGESRAKEKDRRKTWQKVLEDEMRSSKTEFKIVYKGSHSFLISFLPSFSKKH
jgi:hypothetical protein